MTVKKKLYRIKESRIKPVEYIKFNLIEFYSAEYPGSILYKIDNNLLLAYDKNKRLLWFHYEILKTKYDIPYDEAKKLIIDIVWESLKTKGVAQPIGVISSPYMIWEQINKHWL